MRRIILSLLLLALPFSANAARELPKPKLMAVYFYADWCANCKVLSPKIMEARTKGDLDKKEVLFVTLNLTDKTTIHQAVLLSSALGIGDYVKQQGSSTGYIAILDATKKSELARFDRANSSEEIEKGFTGLLNK